MKYLVIWSGVGEVRQDVLTGEDVAKMFVRMIRNAGAEIIATYELKEVEL